MCRTDQYKSAHHWWDKRSRNSAQCVLYLHGLEELVSIVASYIQDGGVKGILGDKVHGLCVAVLGEGDFLGGIGNIEHKPRSATARAPGKARTLTVKKGLTARYSKGFITRPGFAGDSV